MRSNKIKIFTCMLVMTLSSFFLIPHDEIQLKSEIPKLGEISLRAIISPKNFDIPKPKADLIREQKQARESVPFVFEEDEDRTHQMRLRFYELIEDIKKYHSLTEKINRRNGKISSLEKAQSIELYETLSRQISQSALNSLLKNLDKINIIERHFNIIIEEGISESFIAPNKRNLELYKKQFNLSRPKHLLYNKPIIKLIKADEETQVPTKKLKPAEIRVENHFEAIKREVPNNQALLSAIYEVLYASVVPNILYMERETQNRQEKEASQILKIKGKVLEGATLVSPGEIITVEIIEKLKALQAELKKSKENNSRVYTPIGLFILCLILALAYSLFVFKKHPRWLDNNRFYLALVSLPVLQFLLISSNIQLEQEFNALFQFNQFEGTSTWYLTPFVFSAILGTVLFSLELGLILSIVSAFYFAMLTGFDLSMLLTSLLTSIIIAWNLENIKYRSQFIIAAGLGSLVFCLLILTTSLLRSQLNTPEIFIEFAFASANILITIAICGLIFIPLFEKVFKITTNLTLIELSDFNHPALRHISINAPSTFHHSIMVGNLAEKAVERIGGNPLLVRVMALYHDIGKTIQPEYFTENQKGSKSKHEDLSPLESSKVIASHVSDAIKLALEYKLPPLIISGIPEHHGTGLIKYFYYKAQEHGLDPKEIDYQYAGPKPQRKETVALMVADAVEATTRSLKNPQPEELADVVHKVIQTRLYENQFDEANITLKDLKEMEIGFLQALEGMFHTRIAYPKNVWLEKPETKTEKNQKK